MNLLTKFTGAALLGALALLAAPAAQAQVRIGITVGTPAWGPQVPYGTQYYYLPEIDGYYDLYNQQYIVFQDGYWVPLPELYGYDPYQFHPVVVQYRGREPWLQNSYFHQRYAYQPYRNYGRDGYGNGYYTNGYGRGNYPGGGYYGSGRGYNYHDRDNYGRGYGGSYGSGRGDRDGRDDRDGRGDRDGRSDRDGRGDHGNGGYTNGPRNGQPQYRNGSTYGGNGGGPRGGGYNGQPQPPQPGDNGGQAHGGPSNSPGNGQGQGNNGQDQGGSRRRRD